LPTEYVANKKAWMTSEIFTNWLHQIDSTSLHLLFQRNFTLLNVINYQDFLTNYDNYGLIIGHFHCRQRAPVGNALSSSGTSQIGMFDIQATTKRKYYDHIVLLTNVRK
jgi:hypothetical protein